MKRIQLFEFEDFHWFPDAIRTGMANLIVVLQRLIGTREVIAGLIDSIGKRFKFSQIVDLGSGSGGAMPEVVRKINATRPEHPIKLILSDLHPNPDLVDRINSSGEENIHYHPTSLDASHFTQHPDRYGIIYDTVCKTIALVSTPVYLSDPGHPLVLCLGRAGFPGANVYLQGY